ncbi:MAG: hypothetical protein HFF18_05840 [Oscillospiraceae bacterium]|nr:hypothetical protein [Oscillospiraceae bacterium]
MFYSIGQKLQSMAYVFFFLILILTIISTVTTLAAGIPAALTILITGLLAALIFSYLLSAVGQLADDVHYLRVNGVKIKESAPPPVSPPVYPAASPRQPAEPLKTTYKNSRYMD